MMSSILDRVESVFVGNRQLTQKLLAEVRAAALVAPVVPAREHDHNQRKDDDPYRRQQHVNLQKFNVRCGHSRRLNAGVASARVHRAKWSGTPRLGR